MISWLIIVVLVIVGVFVLKINHFRHRMWVVLLILFALFLYVSITVVNSKNDLKFDSTEGFVNSAKIYFGWLGNGFQNMKILVGNAIKMDWTSSNESMLDKKNTSLKSNPNVNTK